MLARRSESLVSVALAIAVATTTVAHGSMPRKCCCQEKSGRPTTCCQHVKVSLQQAGCPHCQRRSQSNEGQEPCFSDDTVCRCGCKAMPKPIPAVRIVVSTVLELDWATPHAQMFFVAAGTGRGLHVQQSTAIPNSGPPPQALRCIWRI